MGQQDVTDFLKGNPKGWFTSREISEGTSRSIGSVTVCLKKLRKRNEIRFRSDVKGPRGRSIFVYSSKD
jgi:predicted transcriptional regulator